MHFYPFLIALPEPESSKFDLELVIQVAVILAVILTVVEWLVVVELLVWWGKMWAKGLFADVSSKLHLLLVLSPTLPLTLI